MSQKQVTKEAEIKQAMKKLKKSSTKGSSTAKAMFNFFENEVSPHEVYKDRPIFGKSSYRISFIVGEWNKAGVKEKDGNVIRPTVRISNDENYIPMLELLYSDSVFCKNPIKLSRDYENVDMKVSYHNKSCNFPIVTQEISPHFVTDYEKLVSISQKFSRNLKKYVPKDILSNCWGVNVLGK